MSTRIHRFIVALGLVLSFAGAARADEAALEGTGFRAELVRTLGFYEKKLVSLLEAIPQEKLGWRAAEGTKSLSEIAIHLANAPAAIGGFITGQKPDFKAMQKAEKETTEKAAVLDAVKKGFAKAREIVIATADADLEKTVKAPWGIDMSRRAFLNMFLVHTAEHFGQLTAHARNNGIVPPWILAAQKKAAEKKAAEEKK